MDKHSSIFQDDWGTLKDIKARLNVKPGSHPKFCKARPVPYAIKPKVEDELDRLVGVGVLTKVNYSEWGTPIVPVMKKDGSVRLCGDFKVTLNPVLEVDQYPLPRTADIFASLAGQKFSKLDLQHAYLQMEVEESSRDLLTINTEKGLYRFNRLVYGVASAPAMWQRAMDTVLQGLKGVQCIIDDMLITGSTDEEHLQNLEAVLERLDRYGLRLRKDKFLHPLHRLLEKNRKWEWNGDCARAFAEVKKLVTSNEVLTHWVVCHASPHKPNNQHQGWPGEPAFLHARPVASP
ncbi:uncharacterized protein K02A2.6-like [Pecten maximus]|uniref:uncharacterized protein K02A2.6-like n=1 Tax=Pecten maximus TaxID=6579 RepID=UPI00145909BD|nr:uncharacterized protein K02A2.6-like [Pecten maximus]